MERSEYPTEEKLNALKLQGVVPLSILSVRILGFLILILVLHLTVPGIFYDVSKIIRDYLSGVNDTLYTTSHLAKEISVLLVKLVVLPLTVVAICSLIWGLSQTKFLFSLSLINIDFRNLWFSKESESSFGLKFIKSVFAISILIICAFAVSIAIPLFLSRDVLTLFNLDQPHLLTAMINLVNSLLPIFIIVGFFFIIISWLIARYRFMLKHGMTRREIEDEAKAR